MIIAKKSLLGEVVQQELNNDSLILIKIKSQIGNIFVISTYIHPSPEYKVLN